MIILAFAALLRIKSIERVRYWDPGELGKLVGLDRIPEVCTLRKKIKCLSEHGSLESWSKQLAQYRMEKYPDLAGILYVDGHVRVYHGARTNLPKRYVARERLCLRGVTDQKYAHEDWPESEFEEKEVVFPNREVVFMKLAERGVYLSI